MLRARFSPITARPTTPMKRFWVLVEVRVVGAGMVAVMAAPGAAGGSPRHPDERTDHLRVLSRIVVALGDGVRRLWRGGPGSSPGATPRRRRARSSAAG